jgi:hypothetical protein
MPRTISFCVFLALLSLPVFVDSLQAKEVSNPQLLTFYVGQGVDSDLLEIFPDMVTGDLSMDRTYLYALGYYHPHENPEILQKVFDSLWIPNTRAGFEFVLGKHDGLQDNWETNLAWQLRFAPWRISQLHIRPGIGLGFSYAWGTPSYEDGPKDDPDRRYRFQNFNTYELDWSLASVPRVSLVTRIHHRSGIFGLVAPRRVGSNFLTVGLRYSF